MNLFSGYDHHQYESLSSPPQDAVWQAWKRAQVLLRNKYKYKDKDTQTKTNTQDAVWQAQVLSFYQRHHQTVTTVSYHQRNHLTLNVTI